jgi:hypothetical protein
MTYARFKAELDAVEAMRRMGWLLYLSRVGGLPYLMGLEMMWKSNVGINRPGRMCFTQAFNPTEWD